MLNPLTHRKVLKKGMPGRATIVAASPPSRGASSFNMAMTLQVYVEGLAPYEVEDQWMVKAKDTEALSGSIPVKVDRDEHDKVAIDWDALRDEFEQETAQRRAALAAQGPVGDIDAFGAAAAGFGAQAVTPVVDIRNDPELRGKLEALLGYELTPGTSITVAENDPQLQMQIMQVISEHVAEQQSVGVAATDDDDPDDMLSRLERLTALRDKGALTPEEFAEQKRKLLEGSA